MLEEKLGYKFSDKKLLETALTHKSCSIKGSNIKNNERLEFLGDSILGYSTAEYLYRRYKNLAEGELTKIRSIVVCEKSLFKVAKRIGLGQYIKLGKGEEQTDGRNRPSILSDAMEAVFAAVYLDSNIETARKVIINLIEPEIVEAVVARDYRDFKTLLQELTQKGGGAAPEYELISESGPDHNKTFTVKVSVAGKKLAEGTGSSKKEAEKMAARKAIEILHKFNNL